MTIQRSPMAPVLFVFGTLFLLIVALFTFLFLTTKIPPVNPYIGTQASIVTYSDGTEIGRFASENRIEVDLKSIPLFVRRAVLAAEDQSFYEQPAFSLKSIARALVNNLSGGETQGGSTITQQYVKIAYLSQEKTLERKLRELIIAIKLEYNFDKNSIMESYLNTIYFGRGAYGIQTASNQYFGRSVSQLTVSQAIVLASVIRSPGLYDPRSQTENFSRLEGRFNLVKQVMFENSWISKSVFDEIEFPETNLIKALNTFGGVKGHIMEEVRKELAKNGFTTEQIVQGGLRVRTTIDREQQMAAELAVLRESPKDPPEDLHIGLIAIKPGDGAITAMYGGRDYLNRQLNDVTQSITQAGSTFKTFALVAALERGIPLSSIWDGKSPQIFYGAGSPYTVRNYGNASFGKISLLRATALSVNTIFVRVAYRVGFASIVDAARRAGIPESVEMIPTPSFVLGVSSPRVIDVANSFATFAAEGLKSKPYLVSEVLQLGDKRIYEVKKEVNRVFAKNVMADLNYALRGVIRSGTASSALGNFPRPVAGKTGTSQNNASAWFVGYTPQIATAVALFRDDATEELTNIGGLQSVTGGSFPARIWNRFSLKALENLPVANFAYPAFIGGTKPIDLINPSPTPKPSASKAKKDAPPKIPSIPKGSGKPIPLPNTSVKPIPLPNTTVKPIP
jgi:membrane peptidoglycan carboxypeptidase